MSSPSGAAPGGGRQQPGVGPLERRAGVGEDEGAGAVGALGVPGVEAGLAEQRRLLVTGQARDRQLEAAERRGVGGADLAPVGDQLRQGVTGYAEERAQLVGPLPGREVHQQRAAGVGDVGDVPGATGHPGDEIGVDGADGVPALLDERPGAGLVLLQPGQLGAREVGVEAEAGQLGDALLVTGVAEALADRGGAAVLPDDGAARGPERLAVPEQHGLALVGDADRSEVLRVVRLECGSGGLEGRLPDLLGCVLDPAGLREVLGELLVAPGRDPALRRDDQRGDAGGPGVDREHAHRSVAASRSRSRICWSIHAPPASTLIS